MDMRRVGSFMVTDQLRYEGGETFEAVQRLMGEVFICSCIHNFGYGRFEYIGFSELFDVVEEGCEAPSYDIRLTETDDDGIVAHFQKVY